MRGIDAAHQLAHDVHVGRVDDPGRVGREGLGRQGHVPGALRVPHGDPRHLDAAARAHLDVVGEVVQQAEQGRADVAAAEQPDPDDALAHVRSPLSPSQVAISISSSSP